VLVLPLRDRSRPTSILALPCLRLEAKHRRPELPCLRLEAKHRRPVLPCLRLEAKRRRPELPCLRLEAKHRRPELPCLRLEAKHRGPALAALRREAKPGQLYASQAKSAHELLDGKFAPRSKSFIISLRFASSRRRPGNRSFCLFLWRFILCCHNCNS